MRLLSLLTFIVISTCIYGQDLKYGTISYSGYSYTYGSYKGGFTIGEVGVQNYIGTVKYLEGFQHIGKDDPYPSCLVVYSILSYGEGSFREAVECAQPGDNIVFDQSLTNQYIFFDLPVIDINKPVSITNTTNGTIKFRNQNVNNTETLILFDENIIVNGVELEGINGGLIVDIVSPYTVIWK